jgi:hypothetical protein
VARKDELKLSEPSLRGAKRRSNRLINQRDEIVLEGHHVYRIRCGAVAAARRGGA